MTSILLSLALLANSVHAERIRRVKMNKDQIAKVQTAIGVATIIQVPDTPTSLVVGNQDAFKVEFLETAITVKPLSSSAKSNLYIYTDYRRFDVQLVTVPESFADYVVYLESVNPKPVRKTEETTWKAMSLQHRNGTLNLFVRRVGKLSSSVFVDFEVTSIKEITFSPEWVWITQGKKTIPIQRLVLSTFKTGPSMPLRGIVELLISDFKPSEPFTFEVRAPKALKIIIPRTTEWKL